MNPDEIRKKINENLGVVTNGDDDFDEDDEESSGKLSIPYFFGYLIGALIVIAVTWLAYEAIYDDFGLPELTFIEFGALYFLIFQILRFFRK